MTLVASFFVIFNESHLGLVGSQLQDLVEYGLLRHNRHLRPLSFYSGNSYRKKYIYICIMCPLLSSASSMVIIFPSSKESLSNKTFASAFFLLANF
jgi:hypothetical protein